MGESAGMRSVAGSNEGLDDVPRDPLLLAGLQGAALRRAKGEEGAPLGGGHGGGTLGGDAEVLVVTEGEGTRSAPSRRTRAGVQPEGKQDRAAGPQHSEFEVAGEGGARVTATGLLPAVMRARARGMRGVGDERAGGLTGLQWRSAGEAARRRALKGIYGTGGGGSGAGVPGQVGPAGSSQLEGLGVASLDEGFSAGASLVGAGGAGDGRNGSAEDVGDEAEEEEREAAAALEEEVRRMRAELRSSRLGRSGGGQRSSG